MLLFKMMRGISANISLDITPFHDGWAYFCTDDGGFYIDSEVDGVQKRTRTNALRYNEGKIESYENGTWVEVPLDIEELESHVANTDIHVTADDKAAWNTKENAGVASSLVTTHNTAEDAHNDIRILINGLTTRLNALADSDDTTLDQLSEIVAYIKSNKSLIESITTNKVNVADIIDNLTTNATDKPLSAAQGVALKGLIDDLIENGVGSSDEIYIGSGDMPEGYVMQIDPSGEADNFATREDINTAIASLNYATQEDINSAIAALPTEDWVFTLEDGTTVTKKVVVLG